MTAFRWFVFGYVVHLWVTEFAEWLYERRHPAAHRDGQADG